MRILVCGGRDFKDWKLLRDTLDVFLPQPIEDRIGLMNNRHITIISGCAKGADSLAFDWASIHRTNYEGYPADWEKYGKLAGYIRNKRMLDEGKPDLVIAFPGGKGTAMMVKIAKEAGVEVREIEGFN